jgi:hypothetical protein
MAHHISLLFVFGNTGNNPSFLQTAKETPDDLE